MIILGFYGLIEIILGIFFWWIGIYLLSRDPRSTISWLVFGLLAGFGIVIAVDPLYGYAPDLGSYWLWQKVLDWSLYFGPVFSYHASLLVNNKNKYNRKVLIIFYVMAVIFYAIDLIGGYVIKDGVIREDLKPSDQRYGFVFTPGILLTPLILFECNALFLSARNFYRQARQQRVFLVPAIGNIFFILSAIAVMVGYYTQVPYTAIYFNALISIGALMIIFSIIRFQLFAPTEKLIFGQNFLYRTICIGTIILIYAGIGKFSGLVLTYNTLVLIVLSFLAILTTHSFYDWFITFINDLLYNPQSGLSVVSDTEIYQALKNYDHPEKIENSPLLRLNLIKQKLRDGTSKTPLDALKSVIEEAIDYFKSQRDINIRTKKNLKYNLLRLLTFNEAEEGQILWELGFDDYPVRIMTKESNKRPPMFREFSPADYAYTSRNAYLALKKEAIHDITWRISYLEKLSKKKML